MKTIKLPKEYTIIALTIQNLIEDGWNLIVGKNGIISEAENKSNDEIVYFQKEKEFKDWILEKSMDY